MVMIMVHVYEPVTPLRNELSFDLSKPGAIYMPDARSHKLVQITDCVIIMGSQTPL